MNSYTPSLAELEIRLAKLERQNRRLKRLGLLFLLIVGSGFLLAQAPRKPLRAAPTPAVHAATYDTLVVHRLELRDKAGNLRGLWTVANDSPFLALYDGPGKLRAVLGLPAGRPYLTFVDDAGKPRAGLGVTTDGPALVLRDAAGKIRASLLVPAEGPALELRDAAGKPRAWLAENTFFVTDAQGLKAVVGVTQTETTKTGESHTTSAAAVTLFGKDGKVIWRAP